MRPITLSAILTLTLAAAAPAMAASLKDVAPYPEAEKGYTRQVIHLPDQADESAYKLEILAGKTLKVDCNRQHLGGNLEGTRIPRLHLENITEPQILAELDALIGRWAKDRNPGECFGDFVIRAGIIAPVIDSARDFYAA